MTEPLLTDEDRDIWHRWERECVTYARLREHRRRVGHARRVVHEMMARAPDAYLAWSAGKDSTALVHLALAEGVPGRIMSIKDDLDFPSERPYLVARALEWDCLDELDVLTPSFSLLGWLAEHADELDPGEDLHGRAAAFADAAFYALIEEYRNRQETPGVYLGMRADESRGRAMNYATRGAIYRKEDGEVVCQPLATWTGRDVWAYLFTHEIEPLDVYRCVRLHEHPSRVRKSWWLPGSHSRWGAAVWLRTYYPSLFARLTEAMPDVRKWI